jgi:hypothetical protein
MTNYTNFSTLVFMQKVYHLLTQQKKGTKLNNSKQLRKAIKPFPEIPEKLTHKVEKDESIP